jgi:hypothetical protein
MSLAQTSPFNICDTSLASAESSTSVALHERIDFLLRGEEKSSTAPPTRTAAGAPRVEPGANLWSFCNAGIYINEIRGASPDKEVMVSSLYSPNVTATIVAPSQDLWVTPDKMFGVGLTYPTSFVVAVPMLRRLTLIERLSHEYAIGESTKVLGFIQRNQLADVLIDAVEPIKKAFGESLTRRLTLAEDDEGSRTLFCLVKFPGSLEQAQQALRSFDRNWWLENARDFGSKLNFDFELA